MLRRGVFGTHASPAEVSLDNRPQTDDLVLTQRFRDDLLPPAEACRRSRGRR
jgi:hypothetical protein